jgi:hypothetical protein
MACRGCSQTGDCACAVVGDGAIIVVTGTGSALDPYTIEFDGCEWVNTLVEADPDLCTTDPYMVVKLEDDSCALIPVPKPCARLL